MLKHATGSAPDRQGGQVHNAAVNFWGLHLGHREGASTPW
jgi:hypothetical protein